MLSLLKIRNLALIDELLWEPGEKLTGITGETGAGKSVIIHALKLVLGDRADKSVIRSGETSCIVEAVFDLGTLASSPKSPAPSSPLDILLDDAGLPPCENGQLILKRILTPSSNKQFVNNSPATLTLIKAIGEHLIDLHGPHDHQSLLSPEKQLVMLDLYAGLQEDRVAYSALWDRRQAAAKHYHDLKDARDLSALELDLLRHQLVEIESADLENENEATLHDQWQRSRHAGRLLDITRRILSSLQGEDSSLSARLSALLRDAHELERYDASTSSMLAPLSECHALIADLEHALSRYLSSLDTDPEEALRLEDRLNLIESLKRKYGTTLSDIITYGHSVRERLDSVEHRQDLVSAALTALQEADATLLGAARALSRKRRKALSGLEQNISTHLKDLGFFQSLIRIDLSPTEDPTPTGIDKVEFLISPNPGEPPKPLRHIASGGEMARIMLAVKSSLAEQDSTPLLVFDEIDANVGGEVARRVGEKMAALGQRHQVIAITHFPQVAALADRHFLVAKNVTQGRTVSKISELIGKNRVLELVRMLGGGGDSAHRHAEELLSSSASSSLKANP